MTLNIKTICILLLIIGFSSFTSQIEKKKIFIVITEKVCLQCIVELNEALTENKYADEKYKNIYLSFYIPKRGNIQKQLYKEKYPNWSNSSTQFVFLDELPERLRDDSLALEPSPIIYVQENNEYSKYELDKLFNKDGKFLSYNKIFN